MPLFTDWRSTKWEPRTEGIRHASLPIDMSLLKRLLQWKPENVKARGIAARFYTGSEIGIFFVVCFSFQAAYINLKLR